MKIKLLLLGSMVFTCANIFAQTTTWDSTFRPSTYRERLEEFANAPLQKGDIVFLGNSITYRGEWSKLLKMSNVKNYGIPGDITYGVLERLNQITKAHPSKIFILIGINDILKGIPEANIIANHKRIVTQIQKNAPETQIYLQTILPINNTFPGKKEAFNKSKQIIAVNSAMQNLKGKKVKIVDIYTSFLDTEKRLKAELATDGIHLTPQGYEYWIKILKEGGYL